MSPAYATRRMLREVDVSVDALQFVSAMIDAAGWSAGDVLYFLDKPWKWADEFVMWYERGRPTAGSEGFAAFAALIEAAS